MKCEYLTNPEERIRVEKGWGYEDWLWNEEYCGKILFFKSGKRCSWHYHPIKDEVLTLFSGKIVLKYSKEDDLEKSEEIVMIPGMAFHVVPGIRHQMIALEDSHMFEVSTHHEDEDSIKVIRGD